MLLLVRDENFEVQQVLKDLFEQAKTTCSMSLVQNKWVNYC